jgi:hypothetical protein
MIKFDQIKAGDNIIVICGGETNRYNSDGAKTGYGNYKNALATNLAAVTHLLRKLSDLGVNITVYVPAIYPDEHAYNQSLDIENYKSGQPMTKEFVDNIVQEMTNHLDEKKEDTTFFKTLHYTELGNTVTINNTNFSVKDGDSKKINEAIKRSREENNVTHVFVVAHGKEGTKDIPGSFIIMHCKGQDAISFQGEASSLLSNESIGGVQIFMNACHGDTYPHSTTPEELEKKNIKFLSIAKEKDDLADNGKMVKLIDNLQTDTVVVKEGFYAEINAKKEEEQKKEKPESASNFYFFKVAANEKDRVLDCLKETLSRKTYRSIKENQEGEVWTIEVHDCDENDKNTLIAYNFQNSNEPNQNNNGSKLVPEEPKIDTSDKRSQELQGEKTNFSDKTGSNKEIKDKKKEKGKEKQKTTFQEDANQRFNDVRGGFAPRRWLNVR